MLSGVGQNSFELMKLVRSQIILLSDFLHPQKRDAYYSAIINYDDKNLKMRPEIKVDLYDTSPMDQNTFDHRKPYVLAESWKSEELSQYDNAYLKKKTNRNQFKMF